MSKYRAPTRQPGEGVESFVYGMNERRKKLAEALGLKEGEEHLAVNDRLHGLYILKKSRISKLEQRQIKQKNLLNYEKPDEAVSSKLVGKNLKTTYFDVDETRAETADVGCPGGGRVRDPPILRVRIEAAKRSRAEEVPHPALAVLRTTVRMVKKKPRSRGNERASWLRGSRRKRFLGKSLIPRRNPGRRSASLRAEWTVSPTGGSRPTSDTDLQRTSWTPTSGTLSVAS